MQPYEQVLASLPSKCNEPYTKPCHVTESDTNSLMLSITLPFHAQFSIIKKPVISINLLSLGKLLLFGMIFH